ncbi:MAG TPA: hypothetical protein ACFCUY_14295 [Xenococcaceae cyanobacterium]|jgi:hypothetical protein
MFKSNLLTKLGVSTLFLALASVAITVPPSLQAQETDSNSTIENLNDDATDLVGETVTVRGQVAEIEPGMSFTIEEEGFLQGDDVLVVNVSGEMLPEMPDDELEMQVTGEVGRFVYADVNSLYDFDLDPDLYADYEDQPVIFATSLTLSPNIGDITDRPENFYGKEVAIEGEVGEIKSEQAFTINEGELLGENNLLVVNVTGEPIPAEEENVVVTGTFVLLSFPT